MGPDFPVTELWKVVVGAKPGRSEKKQTTVFGSVGFAIEDFSALRRARQRLAGADFHQELDLVARLRFKLLKRRAMRAKNGGMRSMRNCCSTTPTFKRHRSGGTDGRFGQDTCLSGIAREWQRSARSGHPLGR